MTELGAAINDLLAERGRPAVVASDLDGTLLRSDLSLSVRTGTAVRALRTNGIGFVMVTARPPRMVDHLAHLVDDSGIVICGNGAFVYDVATRTVLAEHTMTVDVLAALIADLRDGVPGITFGFERADGLALEEVHHTDYAQPGARMGRAEDLIEDGPVGKLLARAPHLDPDDFIAAVTRTIGERATLAYSGASGLAEISALGVTKAVALQQWCDERHVSASSVWACGDMPNDLPMLGWAGVSVAVANADPAVRDSADLVAPANDDDGVAAVLEHLVRAGSSLEHRVPWTTDESARRSRRRL